MAGWYCDATYFLNNWSATFINRVGVWPTHLKKILDLLLTHIILYHKKILITWKVVQVNCTMPYNKTKTPLFFSVLFSVKLVLGQWKSCLYLCSDNVASMMGHKSGVIARIKAVNPNIMAMHCMLHHQAPAPKLHSLLSAVVTNVKFIKLGALQMHCCFTQ